MGLANWAENRFEEDLAPNKFFYISTHTVVKSQVKINIEDSLLNVVSQLIMSFDWGASFRFRWSKTQSGFQ